MKRVVPTIAVFLTALALTLLTWHQARRNADLRDRERFNRVSGIIADAISDRMSAYRNMLEQTRSVFHLNPLISPAQWREYVESLRIDERYPGIQGLGFAPAIPASTLAAELARIRGLQNATGFRIWPEGARDLYVPILLHEPRDWRNERAIGFDMYSEPVRRAAMDAAIESGQARMTDVVKLVQETNTDPQPGFLIYMPVFKAGAPVTNAQQRQAAIVGFVYSPFRARDLFDAIKVDVSAISEIRNIDFEVYLDSGSQSPALAPTIFDSDGTVRAGAKDADFLRDRVIAIPVGGQLLKLHIFGLEGSRPLADNWLPTAILALGLALTILLTRLFWSNLRQSDRLGKSERQLRLVTDTLPAVVGYVDPDGKLQFVNRLFDDWFAATGASSNGRLARDVLGEDNFKRIEPGLRDAVQGRSMKLECELRLRRGGTLLVDAHFIPDFGPRGRVKGVVTLIDDITERRRAESRSKLLLAATTVLHGSLESVRLAERFASSLVPDFADWVTVDLVEDGGQPRRLSAQHRDPELAPLLQQNSSPAGLGADGENPVEKLIKTREPLFVPAVTADMLAALTSSEQRDLAQRVGVGSVIGVPLWTRERGLGALLFGRCPGSKPFTESDFEFALDIGRRATLAIENLRLFRDVQAANRAKDEFLATVSHELRTPMNVILGWVEILRAEKHAEGELNMILQTVERNAKVQLQLINELLDISRIVSGKLVIHPKPVRIGEAASLAVESVRPAANGKGIALELLRGHELPPVSADPDRLHQILWNLLNNAVKFTPPGGKIVVSIEPVDGGVSVQVKDTGKGIEGRFLPYVFDRFRQEESGANRQHGGLGIGLALVRYLVELHGGTVRAESAGRDKGSTFSFFLPASEAVAQEETKPAPRPVPEETRTRSTWADDRSALADLDILLIDDSPDVRALIERILVKAGATVKTASTAMDALSIFRKGVFDVVLSDIGLPEVDGYELMKRIREMEAGRGRGRTPAAALTAYASDKDARRALEAGFDIHIAKPVTSRDLVERIKTLLHRAPHPDGGVPPISKV